MERVDPTSELGKILVWCFSQKATDLHTQADRRLKAWWLECNCFPPLLKDLTHRTTD